MCGRRRSVEGLSITMFILGLVANASYSLGVLLRVPELNNYFWRNTFPYVLSVLVTSMLDMGIVFQAFIYSGGKGVNE